jgi:hypothetical protein
MIRARVLGLVFGFIGYWWDLDGTSGIMRMRVGCGIMRMRVGCGIMRRNLKR